jgi:RNA polymerase sigma factor (TIGR02999 family)
MGLPGAVMLSDSEVAKLVESSRAGDKAAWGRLIKHVYADLRRIARRNIGKFPLAGTVGTTGLVSEWYLRLATLTPKVESKAHLLNLASRMMRQVLCDYARQRLSGKRGGGEEATTLNDDSSVFSEAENLLMIDNALQALEREEPKWARLFECRYFVGLSEQETAEALGVTLRTVQRDWQRARLWIAEFIAK